MQFNTLSEFRQRGYGCFGPARDALFELTDAVLVTPTVNSFAEFSTAPIFRRRWPSLYEALQDGRPDRLALLNLYVAHLPTRSRILLAGDHTAWPRLDAPTLRDRTFEHQPTKVPGGKPVTIGLGYSTLAVIPKDRGSWALPLLHERIASPESPIGKAIGQLRTVCEKLPSRPLGLWDSEYGCAPFINGTADIPCDKIVRLRPNLCLWGIPVYKGRGRKPLHGAKFKFKDPQAWPKPSEVLSLEDSELGPVSISRWQGQHLKKAAKHPMIVLRVERLKSRDTRRDPKDMWLAWIGETPPPLAEWWSDYLRRFALDHWYRFAKGPLHWTSPQLRTPEQAERWSDLMPFITWELWLARPLAVDNPLPWQKPQTQLTPGRVRQSMGAILARIGTPACEPKPRGKSPGWPKGRQRTPAMRYPVVKKGKQKAKTLKC
jgi:hypothetical protein